MKIALIGKFARIHDEEYIARSFEMIGHDVLRLESRLTLGVMWSSVTEFGPDLLLYGKFPNESAQGDNDACQKFIELVGGKGVKTAAWLFDLYFGYDREPLVGNRAYFKGGRVFSTDGGHAADWERLGISHECVRQGIYREECRLLDFDSPAGIAFVGSHNGGNMERVETLSQIRIHFGPLFSWYGKKDTNELRGMDLNRLYAKTKVIVGDSVYSDRYWSNRVVETLGRGGFLIHVEVPGIREAYPHLVTYRRGDMADLFNKISHYLNPANERERRKIVNLNYDWVKTRCTADMRCAELISKL